MRTKEKLLMLAHKSNFILYKELALRLRRKLFINKWYIRNLRFNTSKKHDLYDEIVYPLWIDEFIFKYKKELKMVEKIWYWNYKRFDIRFDEWKYAMAEYALWFHLNRIITKFNEEMQ